MMLTIDQLRCRRGVRLLAISADPTAELGIDFEITHETIPSSITIWNEAKLGARPTQAEWEAKADQQNVIQKKIMIRRYCKERISTVIGDSQDLANDALRLSYLAFERHDRALTPKESNEAVTITANIEKIRLMRRARADVADTIVITDTMEDIHERYDAAIASLI